MKIPLRERNLDSGLLQGIKNGVIELAADPFAGCFPHIDPYLQQEINGIVPEFSEPNRRIFMIFSRRTLPFALR